jgi:hypothetical protein
VRKFLVSMLGLSLVAVMAYGVIGSGAQFLFQGGAAQNVQIGTLGFSLSTDTGTVNGNTVTCVPDAPVMSSENGTYAPVGVCHVTITTTGDIPAAISVFALPAAGTTLNPAHLDRFVLSADASSAWLSGGGLMLLNKTPSLDNPLWGFGVGMVNSPAQTHSVTFSFGYDWGLSSISGKDLTNDDMGKIIKMVFTFSASA